MIVSFDVGYKNLAYCVLNDEKRIARWNVVQISDSFDDKVCKNVIKALKDDFSDTSCVQTVVIERQFHHNPKMRVICTAIEAYFLTLDKRVVLMPAIKKFAVLGNKFVVESGARGKSERKRLAVRCVTEMIENEGEKWRALFKNHKKRDDLADCYLQALSYLKQDCSQIKIAPRTIAARLPTVKMIRTKKYSLPALKYYLQELAKTDGVESIPPEDWLVTKIETDRIVRNSYKIHYKTKENVGLCAQELLPQK